EIGRPHALGRERAQRPFAHARAIGEILERHPRRRRHRGGDGVAEIVVASGHCLFLTANSVLVVPAFASRKRGPKRRRYYTRSSPGPAASAWVPAFAGTTRWLGLPN